MFAHVTEFFLSSFLFPWAKKPFRIGAYYCRSEFVDCLYESTESCCCHLDFGVGIASHLKVLCQSFLCDGQGTVRQAILYGNRSCFLLRVKPYQKGGNNDSGRVYS